MHNSAYIEKLSRPMNRISRPRICYCIRQFVLDDAFEPRTAPCIMLFIYINHNKCVKQVGRYDSWLVGVWSTANRTCREECVVAFVCPPNLQQYKLIQVVAARFAIGGSTPPHEKKQSKMGMQKHDTDIPQRLWIFWIRYGPIRSASKSTIYPYASCGPI